MRYRFARALGAAAIVGGLVLAPAAAAEADTIVPGIPGYQAAYDIQSYRLQGMPPTEADLIRYNPNATNDEIAAMKVQADDAWNRQRDIKVSRLNMTEANAAAAASSNWNVSTAVNEARLSAAKNFARETFTPGKVLRGAGTATTALIGLDLAVGTVDNAFQAFGIDANGTVCNSDLAFLGGIVTSTNCATWRDQNPATVNTDATPGTTWGQMCDGTGVCVQLSKVVQRVVKNSAQTQWQSGNVYCFTSTGSTPESNGGALWYRYAADASTLQRGGGIYNASQIGADVPGLCGTAFAAIDQNVGPTSAAAPAAPALWAQWTIKSGSANYVTPQTQVADPERTLSCVIHGDDGQDYTATTAPYHESTGKIPAPTCPSLPAGVSPTKATINQNTAGSAPTKLYSGDRTPRDSELAQKYPTCQKTGLCVRDLLSVRDGNKSCFDLGDSNNPCVGWFDDASKTSDYKCTYGGNPVDLAYCNQYRQTFDPQQRQNGTPYSKPTDGAPSLTQNATLPSGARAGQLAQPVDLASCVAEDIKSGDPWGIIFSPVRCALSWAFTPGPVKLKADVMAIQDAWNATLIGKLNAIAGGWWHALNVAGCRGPHIVYDNPGGKMSAAFSIDAYPMDACAGAALAPYAPISKNLFSAVVAIFATFTVIGTVASVVGFKGPVSGGGE